MAYTLHRSFYHSEKLDKSASTELHPVMIRSFPTLIPKSRAESHIFIQALADKPSTVKLSVNAEELEHVPVEAWGSQHALVLQPFTLTVGVIKEVIKNIH